MEPKSDKNWVLYFGVGLLWAIFTARKAYAPNINIDQIAEVPDDMTIPEHNRFRRTDCGQFKPPCPEGCNKFQRSGGMQKVYYEPECLSDEQYRIASARQRAQIDSMFGNIFNQSQG